MKIINLILISIIKFYIYFVSPYLVSNCRFLPTCSDYFLESIKLNGAFKGSMLGLKRILKCHPIKFLGSGEGFDPAPNLNQKLKRIKK